jgi:hypothetical protein
MNGFVKMWGGGLMPIAECRLLNFKVDARRYDRVSGGSL